MKVKQMKICSMQKLRKHGKEKSVSLALFKGNQVLVYILLICILCLCIFPPYPNDTMLLSSPNDIWYYCFHVTKIFFTFLKLYEVFLLKYS